MKRKQIPTSPTKHDQKESKSGKTTQRKPMNPFKKHLTEKVPASVMAPLLGPRSFKGLQSISKSGFLYDQDLSKKEMKKAMMYSMFWTLDNHRTLSDTLRFVFQTLPNQTRVIVRLRNTTGFDGIEKFTLSISGGGDDMFTQYFVRKDGIRINNRVEFDYELPTPGKRKVVETFLYWLIETYFSKIDLNQSTIFAKWYDRMHQRDDKPAAFKAAASKVASEYSNFLKTKSKSLTSTEQAVVKEMKCCFELLMSRYAA
jgi:hypothetical protein